MKVQNYRFSKKKYITQVDQLTNAEVFHIRRVRNFFKIRTALANTTNQQLPVDFDPVSLSHPVGLP